MDIIAEYKKIVKKYCVVSQALRIAGRYARENIPAEIPSDMEYLTILANGAARDPNGIEYVEKWLAMAEQELGLDKSSE